MLKSIIVVMYKFDILVYKFEHMHIAITFLRLHFIRS